MAMSSSPLEDEDLHLELETELESLQAIFLDELSFSRKTDGRVDQIELLVHPSTGNDTTKQYVCLKLVFRPSSQYPNEIPDFEICNPRGLGEEEMESLAKDMKTKAEEYRGMPMIYTLIEMARDSLTEGNVPHCPCVLCLEHFDHKDNFHRTYCYHYFHTHCLFAYLEISRAAIEEEKRSREAQAKMHQKAEDKGDIGIIVCPVCREPLDDESASVTCELEKNIEEEVFVPSQELKEQQRRMTEMFERQKAKGGIIDLEAEKNKYYVNPDTVVTIPSVAPTGSDGNAASSVTKGQLYHKNRPDDKNSCRAGKKKKHGSKPDHDNKNKHHDQHSTGLKERDTEKTRENLQNEDRNHGFRGERGRGRGQKYDQNDLGSLREIERFGSKNDGHEKHISCQVNEKDSKSELKLSPRSPQKAALVPIKDHKTKDFNHSGDERFRKNMPTSGHPDRGQRGGRGRGYRGGSSRSSKAFENNNGSTKSHERYDGFQRNSEERFQSRHVRYKSDDEDSVTSQQSVGRYDTSERNQKSFDSRSSKGRRGGQISGHRYERQLNTKRYQGNDSDISGNVSDNSEQDGNYNTSKAYRKLVSDRGGAKEFKSYKDNFSGDRHNQGGAKKSSRSQKERYSHSNHWQKDDGPDRSKPQPKRSQQYRNDEYHGERQSDNHEYRRDPGRGGFHRNNAGQGKNEGLRGHRDADEEEEEDNGLARDLSNYEINQQWRQLNFGKEMSSTNAPIRFGVYDDDSDDERVLFKEKKDKEAMFERLQAFDESVHAFCNTVYDKDDCSWENEMDHYAFEQRHIRHKDWDKYMEYKKPQLEEQVRNMKERFETEKALQEEERRLKNEVVQMRTIAEGRQREGTAPAKPAKSILDQFKDAQKQKRDGDGKTNKVHDKSKNSSSHKHQTEQKTEDKHINTGQKVEDIQWVGEPRKTDSDARKSYTDHQPRRNNKEDNSYHYNETRPLDNNKLKKKWIKEEEDPYHEAWARRSEDERAKGHRQANREDKFYKRSNNSNGDTDDDAHSTTSSSLSIPNNVNRNIQHISNTSNSDDDSKNSIISIDTSGKRVQHSKVKTRDNRRTTVTHDSLSNADSVNVTANDLAQLNINANPQSPSASFNQIKKMQALKKAKPLDFTKKAKPLDFTKKTKPIGDADSVDETASDSSQLSINTDSQPPVSFNQSKPVQSLKKSKPLDFTKKPKPLDFTKKKQSGSSQNIPTEARDLS